MCATHPQMVLTEEPCITWWCPQVLAVSTQLQSPVMVDVTQAHIHYLSSGEVTITGCGHFLFYLSFEEETMIRTTLFCYSVCSCTCRSGHVSFLTLYAPFLSGGNARILATGGASNNSVILQVLADVFNSPVHTLVSFQKEALTLILLYYLLS